MQYAISTTSPIQSYNDSRVQSPEQADDGRMKRGAIELPRLTLQIPTNQHLLILKKKIIIGNINQFITPDKRALNYEKCAYRWLIYVRTKHAIDVTTFVKKVRFYLHASYKPHEVVDINRPPFYIMRLGWGEFIARIQIFFHDTRNAPIDIPYHLKLDQQSTGKELLGDEKQYDLHLNKDTEFKLPTSFPGHDKPLEPQIPKVECNMCGGHCKINQIPHLYPSISEGFQFPDVKTINMLNTHRILPSAQQQQIREPTCTLELQLVKQQAAICSSLEVDEAATVLLAAVILFYFINVEYKVIFKDINE